MEKLDLDIAEIARRYIEGGESVRSIASSFGCSTMVIYARLEEAGIGRTSRACIPVAELQHLYLVEGLSLRALADRFDVSAATIRRHLRFQGVKTRGRVESRQPMGRRPAPPRVALRAYMLGLVWGDFAAERTSPRSQTVQLRSNTTQQAQVDLAIEVFESYGKVTIRRDEKAMGIRISLDDSFRFLMQKYENELPSWIVGESVSAAFASGYIDAEGSFGVYDGRARLKIDAYDEVVLRWMHEWMAEVGVRSKCRRVGRHGEPRRDGSQFNADLYRVNVNEAHSMLRLTATLEPFLRHRTRCTSMMEARSNVLERLRRRVNYEL